MVRNEKMKSLVTAVLVVGCLSSDQGRACSLAELRWMTGAWQNSKEPDRAQERWAAAPNGVLMGTAWEFPQGKSGYSEIMTMKQEGEKVVMVLRHFDGGLTHAWEEREAPMIFEVHSCKDESVVLDGRGDRAGEHLSYTRTGDKLLITGDFIHNGQTSHVEWPMMKAD